MWPNSWYHNHLLSHLVVRVCPVFCLHHHFEGEGLVCRMDFFFFKINIFYKTLAYFLFMITFGSLFIAVAIVCRAVKILKIKMFNFLESSSKYFAFVNWTANPCRPFLELGGLKLSGGHFWRVNFCKHTSIKANHLKQILAIWHIMYIY